MLGVVEWLIFLVSPFALLVGGVSAARAALVKEGGRAQRIAAGVGSAVAFGAAAALIGLWVWVILQFWGLRGVG